MLYSRHLHLLLEFILRKGSNVRGVGHQGGYGALFVVAGEEMLVRTGSEDTNIFAAVCLRAERHCGLEPELWLRGVYVGQIHATLCIVGIYVAGSIGVRENGEGFLVLRQIGCQGEYVLATVLQEERKGSRLKSVD